MINKQLLLSKLEDNQIQGIVGTILEAPLKSGEHTIQNNSQLNYLELHGSKGELVNDLASYITEFTPELLDKEFDSILIGGLGLGIIPFVVQDFCTTIDIVEINTDIVDVNQQLNVLGTRVNIIEGDIFNFQPTKMYDVIIMDIWYRPISEEVVELLNNTYFQALNEGGFIYYPINSTSKETNSTIIKWQR